MGKVYFLFFHELFDSINEIFILGDWALGYYSINFKHFPDFS